ncbi:MAG: macro domain-containing protein [Gemmatimonadetes bacterium]|nr:macro domain-containing protein [Gemmatimonadota bacterium]
MIEIEQGELAEWPGAAVVRPMAADWSPATGVARRIDVRAGESITAQAARLGELPVGSAVVGPGGGLPAGFVIHVVVRSQEEAVSRAGIQRGLRNALLRAVEWGIETLALPPLGTGAGNLDVDTAAEVVMPVLVEHARTHSQPRRIVVVVESAYEREVFERERARLVGG